MVSSSENRAPAFGQQRQAFDVVQGRPPTSSSEVILGLTRPPQQITHQLLWQLSMSPSLQDLENYLFKCADAIRDAVDADYRGWEANQQPVQTVERILLSVLLQKHELGHLLTEDDALTDDIRRYLIQNHG